MKSRCIAILSVVLVMFEGRVLTVQGETVEALAKRSGCFECHSVDKKVIGPAFQDIAATYNFDAGRYDLSVMAVPTTADLPEKRRSLVVVAQIGAGLHIRIFDADGRIVADKPEPKLAEGQALAELKKRLTGDRVLAGTAFSKEDKRKLIESVTVITGHTPARVGEALIETVKNGGKGNWTAITGGVPMPPHSGRLTDAQIRRLVFWLLRPAGAAELRVLKMGLGAGMVTSSPPGINCGADCEETYALGDSITLTANAAAGSEFSHWEGDASGTDNPFTLTMSGHHSVRAIFKLTDAIPTISDFTPEGIRTYLIANPTVNTAGRFLSALPAEYKKNWILMSRSESLQTGTAESPRLLLPSADARSVFTIGMTTHSAYPGSHPHAIEYMQWDAGDKNFRFHEIVLADIPAMGDPVTLPDGTTQPTFPARSRSVSIDDHKCFKCHSTKNVLNRGPYPGTTGVTPGFLKAKNKPNWDTYDSWGGMLPFNRDRIYQGTVETAAFRTLLNPWTWSSNDAVRSVIEQLELQQAGVPASDVITRTSGGPNDGHINFTFDASPPVLVEPAPTGTAPAITTNYSFDRVAGTGPATSVVRGGAFVTLRHSDTPFSDEGRGVQLFDLLGGADGNLNQQRIADELLDHRFATGSVPIDIRPIALAITKGLVRVDAGTNTITGITLDPIAINFFKSRNGMLSINEIVADTRLRAQSIPRRKADIQKLNLDRTGDIYLSTAPGGLANGLIQQFGVKTAAGTDTTMGRLRQEVFRRPIDAGGADATVMGGIFVDRELYSANTEKLALYRYFLEPLGVSIDKWSMGVRGRSRTYSFADVFGSYINVIQPALRNSLVSNPIPGMTNPDDDVQLIQAVESTLAPAKLPPADDIPRFTDVQRIFNKSCIECHGGLNYPPYRNYGNVLDLSEDENPPLLSPPLPGGRLERSHNIASLFSSLIYQKITRPSEACPDYVT